QGRARPDLRGPQTAAALRLHRDDRVRVHGFRGRGAAPGRRRLSGEAFPRHRAGRGEGAPRDRTPARRVGPGPIPRAAARVRVGAGQEGVGGLAAAHRDRDVQRGPRGARRAGDRGSEGRARRARQAARRRHEPAERGDRRRGDGAHAARRYVEAPRPRRGSLPRRAAAGGAPAAGARAPPSRSPGGVSFRTRILFALGAVGLVPLSLAASFSFAASKTELERTVGRAQAAAAPEAARGSERFIARALESLRISTGMLPLRELTRDELAKVLGIPYRQLDFVRALALLNYDGSLLAPPVVGPFISGTGDPAHVQRFLAQVPLR